MVKNRNLKKIPDVELATTFKRLERVCLYHEKIFWDKFEDLQWELKKEIDRRNRALIYKEAVKHLRLGKYENQFSRASRYVDAIMDGSDYFTESESWEIGSFYTKSGNPVLVDLVCHWSRI
jgi:hypothetical protein